MTILALETATTACSAALIHNDHVYSRHRQAPRQHTDFILPMIDELLLEAHINRDAIQAITFGHGPGSFMGTRLATGVAQGLAYALDVPVIPLSTLQIIAQTAYAADGVEKIQVAWDARMSEVYIGFYVLHDGVMQGIQQDQLAKPESVNQSPDFTSVGNGWPLISKDIEFIDCYPHATAALTIAQQKLINGDVMSPLKVEPMYLREAC